MIAQYKNTPSKQRGFSLIEALVAFLILSVGLLGIASLQLLSLKAGHTAALRTVAVIKTEEMFERIRNNPVVVLNYIVLAGDPGDNNGCTGGGAVACNQAQMARDDIYNWKADLKTSLPNNAGTTASIDVQAPVPGVNPTATVTITINWQERNQETQVMDTMSYSVSAHICDNTRC
jgi:type IV pilus assembly protein PilV